MGVADVTEGVERGVIKGTVEWGLMEGDIEGVWWKGV